MSVLTRDEAQTRASLLDVHHYAIDLDLTRGDETFDSRTVIRFTVRAETADTDTFVEVKPAELRTVTLDGHPLDPAALDENRLALKNLTPGEHELRVDAAMRYSRTGEGMHRFTDPADGETYVYTQLFLDDVQRVFAAFDQPDLKAVFDLTVTAPEGWTVLANGITEHTGDGHWKAATTPRISTYLVAVAAGPWHSVRTEHRGLPFGIHCRRSLAPHLDADADELLEVTRGCFDRYHEKFTEPYPFDSYDQAFVPEFNAGAMENPGLVTFRDEFVFRSAVTDTQRQTRAMVIAHEMAHMWFGDLVTLKWWDDIWLNESFAEYMGYQTTAEATRFTDTWTDFGVTRKPWGYDADQRPSTHPVAPENVEDTASALLNFDGISYAKGASALRQLVTWLGEKDFLAGINIHFERHRFANATLGDFIDSLAAATDRDVHAWADAWLRTTGVDTLTPRITGDNGDRALTVDHTGSRPHRIAVGLYDRDLTDEGRLTLRSRLDVDVPQSEPRPIGKRPALAVLNDGDLTYAKIRFDTESFQALRTGLAGLPDPLTRAVVWNALRDAVRDGDLAPTDFLDIARTHLPHERDLALVDGVLTFAGTQVADRYVTPEQRPAALATLTDLCRDLIRRTEDGDHPGLRLIAVRHRIATAAHPDTIAAWLADGTVPGGPELDPELRWRILTRLAVLGATDEAAIAAELAADPSATGQEGAARCRAALPDPEAKTRAWEAMFATDDLSNYLFTATAQGFWQPEQADLVRDYVPRYYAEAVAVAARRGPAIADAAGRWAFPAHAVDTDTLRLGRQCLDDAEPIPALRRKLTDQLDDLARALRVREAAAH
ncbi:MULTISPECIES: aminopeptidase N [Streptomyces]|uniref:Aminopeptidase N n=1 Tax=Streptomyces rochei TaxID=1928 RepID=A0ABW7E5B5_STRRO|nr:MULTISPECIES: aminopeptidase N [Streptomyces]WDI17891.1 aminopeptidase N [Streptomyces enissocaesilis]MBQ0880987.1 aminopeptidase N [Streptomyces sp. RT42]MBU8549166.1 aminopeptidase N [Streptomyces sp. Osf17]MBU8555945.1 aminopeptidase N [Streptomyces sp. Babs14]MDI3095663.1 aminopeptidase N [Streptomyces sp. AN-3]